MPCGGHGWRQRLQEEAWKLKVDRWRGEAPDGHAVSQSVCACSRIGAREGSLNAPHSIPLVENISPPK